VSGRPISSPHRSDMHKVVLDLVKGIYPGFRIEEEVQVDTKVGNKKAKLFVDILIRQMKVAIECHGRQHFEFISHFHASYADFQQARARDQAKVATLVDAGFGVVVIRYDEYKNLTASQLARLITKALEGN